MPAAYLKFKLPGEFRARIVGLIQDPESKIITAQEKEEFIAFLSLCRKSTDPRWKAATLNWRACKTETKDVFKLQLTPGLLAWLHKLSEAELREYWPDLTLQSWQWIRSNAAIPSLSTPPHPPRKTPAKQKPKTSGWVFVPAEDQT